MDSKIKSYVEKFKQSKHKERLLIVACIFGVVLILLSEIKLPATASKNLLKPIISSIFQHWKTKQKA